MDKIIVDGKRFVDKFGRHRIFNGINLCDKGRFDAEKKCKVYNLAFDENVICQLSRCGFNLVRLALTWDGVEPEANRYNEEYLDRIEAIANLCEKYGIYFFLDMHQDLYGGPSCGAPYWACITDGAKFKPTRFVWEEGYFWRKAIHRCFDHFWADTEYEGIPLQTYFFNMWKHVVKRFKDHPALLGFDLLNEPFPGTDGGKIFRKLIFSAVKTIVSDKRCKTGWILKQLISGNAVRILEPFSDPALFRKVTSAGDKLVRNFDVNVYSKFINRAVQTVREVTDKGMIIMENSYYSNIGIPYSAPAACCNGKREKNLCFAPHAYDLMVDTPAYKYASNSRVGSIFDEHKRSQDRLQVPVIVGEWGGQSEGTEWLGHIEYLLDKFDKNQWSQTYWTYYKGLLEDPVMECLVRPAPIAVCGTIEMYYFDRRAKVFTLTYEQDRAYEVSTIIFAHREINNVETDGVYEIVPFKGCSQSIIKICTDTGRHKVQITFR